MHKNRSFPGVLFVQFSDLKFAKKSVIIQSEIKSCPRQRIGEMNMKMYATYNRTFGTWKVTQNRQTLASGQGLDSFIAVFAKYPMAITRWAD
jgi:hypothetical protein